MHLHESVHTLCAAFEQETSALDVLTAEVRKQRLAYVSLLPRALEGAVARMDTLRAEVAEISKRREQGVLALRTQLGLSADARLRDMLPRLPKDLRTALSNATTRVAKAARALRVENAVGARILAFAEQAEDALVHRLAGAGEAPPCYDRNARVRRTPGGGGSLISGTA